MPTSATGQEGFDERFDELSRLAYRVGYRVLGGRAEAEDVAQETMARAFARWGSVQGHADAWVVRVATNQALGVWRRCRHPAVGRVEADEIAVGSHDRAAADRLDLVRVVAALPRRQREVVALRFLADLAEADTARVLGISVGSVKQHTHRALASLRLAIDEPAPLAVPEPGAP